MSYNDFYTSHLGFTPYSYQNKVAELLLSGKNVVLSVPTGSGKTWASIMPFLYAKKNQLHFPSKLIYSLPLRTLTNSIYDDVKNVVCGESISIQTGEFSNDPYFENDIVFSTIDQTLSSFLCFPLSLSRKQANINAGAIVGSYLVFDEFHLLDKRLSMATTIGMLRMLKNMCRFCIMTATLTKEYMEFLKSKLDNIEIVSIGDFDDDKKLIKSLIPANGTQYKKRLNVKEEVLSSEFIISHHINKSIVICNQVEKCQKIYNDLIKSKGDNTKVICIHSRFFDSDRKKKEKQIKEYFGKDSKEKNVILVSTQVIEAGMDITCDTLFTEISPVNSFLQRAGRCARYAFESGCIYVFDVEKNNGKEERDFNKINTESEDERERRKMSDPYLPYDRKLCEQTFQNLKCNHYIDEKIALYLVNDILNETEQKQAKDIMSRLYNEEYIKKAWLDCDKRHYRETIRDIQSIEIALVNLQELKGTYVSPRNYETISVFKWSFIGWAIKISESHADNDDWFCAKVTQNKDSQFDDDWTDGEAYKLCQIQIDELRTYDDIIFVDNHFFDYTDAGLLVRDNNNNQKSPIQGSHNDEKSVISFNMDTYSQHCRASHSCYIQDFKPKLSFLLSSIDDFVGKKYDWNKLILLMFYLHDYGKLNQPWQKLVLDYQRKKMNDESFFEVLAHTDYNSQEDSILADECKLYRRPPHAGIGALQIYEMLYDDYGEGIARAVGCSVLKHHNVDTSNYCAYDIKEEYQKYIIEFTQGFCDISRFVYSSSVGESLSDIIPEKEKEWILYFVMTRLLRICDQKATTNINDYLKNE